MKESWFLRKLDHRQTDRRTDKVIYIRWLFSYQRKKAAKNQKEQQSFSSLSNTKCIIMLLDPLLLKEKI